MKIVNLGSINIDHVYKVNHFVQPGETLQAESYHVFPGGKGYNQSVAIAKSGCEVFHAGKVGEEGEWLVNNLKECGVNTTLVSTSSQPTGHAIIQVDSAGENSIFIFGGANRDIDQKLIDQVFAKLSPGDTLLLQNEVNKMNDILQSTKDRGLNVVFNPAPMTETVPSYDLDAVNWFVVNQVEGAGLTQKSDPEDIIKSLTYRYPKAKILLTLGKDGVIFSENQTKIRVPARKITAVDTTAAGDTFIGFFLGAYTRGKSIEVALNEACSAAAICATREGAAVSIPNHAEVVKLSVS